MHIVFFSFCYKLMIWIFSTEVKEERRCCRRSQTFGKRNCFGWLYKSCWVSDTDALLLIISNQRRIRLQIYLSKSVFCCFIYSLLCRFWSSGADGLLSATCRAQIVVGGTMSWDHRAVITVRQRELHQRPRSAFFYFFIYFLLVIRQKTQIQIVGKLLNIRSDHQSVTSIRYVVIYI